jgi:ATP-binding protein involved in chromosome partitioning
VSAEKGQAPSNEPPDFAAIAELRVAVLSGKGGVGKTSLAVNIAVALVQSLDRVGLLDADITGPNVAQMLGIRTAPEIDGGRIVPHSAHGVHVISIASLIPPESAVIWRGPLRSRAVTQLLEETLWGTLDALVVDLPPGTGDEVLTVGQQVKPQAAVVVTTPQQVAMGDARRAIDMARKMGIRWIGLVENMSGIVCPHCGQPFALFGEGRTSEEAARLDVHDLGTIPLDPQVAQLGDAGTPVLLESPDSPVSLAIRGIAETLRALDPASSSSSQAS